MRKKGAQYCGMTSKDLFHLTILMDIEYATRHEKSVVYGCLSYNFQYAAAVQETGVERFILTARRRITSSSAAAYPSATRTG